MTRTGSVNADPDLGGFFYCGELGVYLAQLRCEAVQPDQELLRNMLGYPRVLLHESAKDVPRKGKCPQPLIGGDRYRMLGLDEHSELANKSAGPQILNEYPSLLDFGTASFAGENEECRVPLFTLSDKLFARLEIALPPRRSDHFEMIGREANE